MNIMELHLTKNVYFYQVKTLSGNCVRQVKNIIEDVIYTNEIMVSAL